jgi:hypothetical protein
MFLPISFMPPKAKMDKALVVVLNLLPPGVLDADSIPFFCYHYVYRSEKERTKLSFWQLF